MDADLRLAEDSYFISIVWLLKQINHIANDPDYLNLVPFVY